ncbi:MAG: hypothetical protein Q8R29_00695 [bacterium]|nr:hypothetical protein [bacterium]
MIKRIFMGGELAQAHLLHLTKQELNDYFKSNKKIKYRVHSDGPLAVLWRRINPGKIFFIRFADSRGVIIMADNEEDACIQAVPFINEQTAHHCKDPIYNKSCADCRKVFDDLADKLNNSTVTWLGWGCPDYNWAIHT